MDLEKFFEEYAVFGMRYGYLINAVLYSLLLVISFFFVHGVSGFLAFIASGVGLTGAVGQYVAIKICSLNDD